MDTGINTSVETKVGREFPRAPLVGVGAVVVQDGRVLLVRRGTEPLKGHWTLPGGMLEVGEALTAGVVREVREETGIDVEPVELIELLDRIHREDGRVRYHYVIADYLCRVTGGELRAASDADAVRWVERCEWNSHSALVLDPITVRVIEKGWQRAEQIGAEQIRAEQVRNERSQLMKRSIRVLALVLIVLFVLAAVAALGFYLRPVSYLNARTYLQEHREGIESHYVDVDSYRMHYLAMGPASGSPVVLIHGLGARAEDWWNVSTYLAKAGFRVYVPDLIGYGRSEQPADFSYSVRDEAGLVVGFMDDLGLKQADLGGWSMGGWIVQLVAFEHPERVSRLILFDSAGLDIKPTWDTGLFTPTSTQQLDELDALLMPNPPAIPPFIARDYLRISAHNAWVIKRALATMKTAQDVTDSLLPQLKMPVLIVWGSLDQIVPLDQAQTMHKLVPQSQLLVIPGCGHLAPLQCGAEMDPGVLQFIRQ